MAELTNQIKEKAAHPSVNGTNSSEIPYIPSSAARPVLTICRDGKDSKNVPCQRIVTLLGSHPHCKIRLEHPSVAPIHAAIIQTGKEVMAVDLVTKNGTFLNGLRMKLEKLKDGDILGIDPWEFRVGFEKPRSTDEGTEIIGLDPAPEGMLLEDVAAGQLLRPTRKLCLIGRRAGCDIAIADPSISRVHALLCFYMDYPAVCDLLSKNGVMVNDVPVQFKILQDEDKLTVGTRRFRIRLAISTVGGTSTAGTGKAAKPSKPYAPVEDAPDLIDIARTESSQQWRIADSFTKPNGDPKAKEK